MSNWTAEVREILAHSHDESNLRIKLEGLCQKYEAQPDPEPEYDYGVAWKAPRRKKWTYPSIDDYGDLEDAQKELKIMQRIPNTEAGIVRRVREGKWEFVDGEPAPLTPEPVEQLDRSTVQAAVDAVEAREGE